MCTRAAPCVRPSQSLYHSCSPRPPCTARPTNIPLVVHVPDFRSKTYLLPQKHTARYGRKELRRVRDPRRLRRRRQAVCIAGYSSRKEDSYVTGNHDVGRLMRRDGQLAPLEERLKQLHQEAAPNTFH